MPRLLILAGLTAVLLAGCSHPAPPPPKQTVDDLNVALASSPPPHVGDNTFSVTLADAATSAPVGNANLTATPEMLSPSGQSLTPSGRGADTSGRAQGNGLYTVPVRLGIATRYALHLKIERPGKPAAEVSFPIEAAQ